MKKAQAAVTEARNEFMAAVRNVLTEEQIKAAGLGRGGANRKKAAAKAGAPKKRKADNAKAKPPEDPKSETIEKKAD